MVQQQLHRAVQQYGDMIYKIAMVILRNPDDAEDAVQNTFLRYYRKAPAFESEEHEKAWLIRCATNVAKSLRATALRHAHEDLTIAANAETPKSILPELLYLLPVPYRIVLQLRYVEGYSAEEIARVLGEKPAAVRKRLERARIRAREIYEKELV